MTNPDYLARLRAVEMRFDSAPPHNFEYLAATGNRAQYREQRATLQSRYFDMMARYAQKAIQSCRQHSDRCQGRLRLVALSGDSRSARRQGLWWHDVEIRASRST